jgi:lysophospholipase L1-like esterase
MPRARTLSAALALAALLAWGAAAAVADSPEHPPVPGLSAAAAIGDSYSSGEGSGPPWDPGTDVEGNRCHRTPLAWPRLLGVPAEGHLACSGAGLADLPGQLAGLAALPDPPSHILVTIGGNDAGFAGILRGCVLGDCVGLIGDQAAALPALGETLEAAYRGIAAAAPGGRVIVVGYPELIPERPPGGLRCLWLSDAEVAAAVPLQRALDAAIAGAAARAGVEFVSLGDAFDGHELCTRRSWLRPIVLDPLTPPDPQQAHPLPAGQAAMAARVGAYLEAAPPETRPPSPPR